MAFSSQDEYRAYHRKWSAENKDRLREYRANRLGKDPEYEKRASKVSRQRNRAQRAGYNRIWRALNPEKQEQMNLRASQKRRGIPQPTRPRPELCECCNGEHNGKGKLHMDHDHKTGLFRGWLCMKCNTGIGKLGDDEFGLQRAIMYLARSQYKN